MATLDELSTALRNADAAGDADAARVLAGEIVKMRAAPAYSGSVLPLSKSAEGKVSFDSNAGLLGSIKRAFTLPGEVMSGQVDPREDIGRVMEMATVVSPVNPAVRAGDQLIPGLAKSLKPQKPTVPTTQELMDTAATDFNKFRKSGMELPTQALSEFSKRAQQDLYDNGGISAVDAANTFTKLKALEDVPQGAVAVTAPNVKSLRESLGITAQNFNPNAAKDQLAASRVINQLDDFVRASDAPRNVAGTAAIAGKTQPYERPSQIYDRARGNAAAAYRSNDITGELDRAYTGILEKSDLRTQAANSGRNADNTIRQRIVDVLVKPKEVSGLSDAEITALAGVVQGGRGRNLARNIGNKLGGGGGAGQTVIGSIGAGLGAIPGIASGTPVGAALGAVAGAAIPGAVGSGARSIANTLAKRDLRNVDEMMRKRSPLYEERVANPNMVPQSPEARAALVRALLMQQQQ